MKHSISIVFMLILNCTFTAQKVEQTSPPDYIDTTDSSHVGSTERQKSFKTLAWLKYHDQVKYLFNSDTTYVLCINTKKPKPNIPKELAPLRFFVYDLKSNEIIFEDSLENGQVYWENNTNIKVNIIPEIVKSYKTINPGYTYNVVSRTKHPVKIK